MKYSSDYVTRPLTKQGITRRLYAATRTEDLEKLYMSDLIRLAGDEARRLQDACRAATRGSGNEAPAPFGQGARYSA